MILKSKIIIFSFIHSLLSSFIYLKHLNSLASHAFIHSFIYSLFANLGSWALISLASLPSAKAKVALTIRPLLPSQASWPYSMSYAITNKKGVKEMVSLTPVIDISPGSMLAMCLMVLLSCSHSTILLHKLIFSLYLIWVPCFRPCIIPLRFFAQTHPH